MVDCASIASEVESTNILNVSMLDPLPRRDLDTRATRPSLLSRVRDPENHAAWHEFEDRYGELILRYARVRGLQLVDAEDVRQAVLLNLSRAMRTFQYSRERGRFRDYVLRAARNAMSALHARNASAPAALVTDGHTAGQEDATEMIDMLWEREWMLHHYRRALQVVRATFDSRSIAMFEQLLAGGSAEAVAQEFLTTPTAVRQLKHRIRERLRELIAAQVEEEDSDA